ncbi:MAG: C1 family peptidase [Spirosomaceae bacterium]|jgi:C1A family cysteine protease|nr:C1 family peptidase [Spirosomataceae bacterium]
MNRIGGYRAGAVPPDAKKKTVEKNNELPQKVDLRKFMTSVELQVGNSCVANAFAGAYEYLAKRQLGDSADVSRLFIYYNARYLADEQDRDNGSMMVNAIEGLKEYGACSEEIWVNDQGMITEEPPQEAYDHAANFRIMEAEYLETDLDLWRATLAEGYPIAFALNTFASFDKATSNRGRVPMPKPSDNVRETHGWHAMLCVGYSDPDQMFIVRNSWGEDWGDAGYCYIPYSYVINMDFNGHDSWIIKSVENLEFDSDLWAEDEESYFAEDGMLYLEDFYVAVEDVEEFATALEELCLAYVESEEDFFFDYEETEEDDIVYIEMSNFEILTEDPDGFLEELETLCQDYAIDENYDYSIVEDGESEEEA